VIRLQLMLNYSAENAMRAPQAARKALQQEKIVFATLANTSVILSTSASIVPPKEWFAWEASSTAPRGQQTITLGSDSAQT